MAESDRIAAFKEVAEEMPDDPEVRFGLAGAYLAAEQAENAVIEYRVMSRGRSDAPCPSGSNVITQLPRLARLRASGICIFCERRSPGISTVVQGPRPWTV